MFLSVIDASNARIEFKVISHSKAINDHIILKTDTKITINFLFILREGTTSVVRFSTIRMDKTYHILNERTFTRSIMTKNTKYFTLIHLKTNIIICCKNFTHFFIVIIVITGGMETDIFSEFVKFINIFHLNVTFHADRILLNIGRIFIILINGILYLTSTTTTKSKTWPFSTSNIFQEES